MTWAEVRAEDPSVFRSAVRGGMLLVPAVASTLLWSSLALEWPVVIALPGGIDWIRGLLTVAVLFLAIGLWVFAWILLSMPADTRRGIAIDRFARERGLMYSRYGIEPERRGILLAEGRSAAPRQPSRIDSRDDPARAPLFRIGFALWRREHAARPSLQIGIASYKGGKNDPKGPRNAFRVLEAALPRRLPHIMIDARGNGSLRAFLPGTQRLSFEGDFDRFFSVYAPEGYERDALELLTPDVMACLVDYGRRWDIEIVDDRVVVASRRFRRGSDRAEYTALLLFSELLSEELGHQAGTYTDPRAERPRTQIARPGRRLRRRSALWAYVFLAAAVAGMLAFPHVLGWLLDRN